MASALEAQWVYVDYRGGQIPAQRRRRCLRGGGSAGENHQGAEEESPTTCRPEIRLVRLPGAIWHVHLQFITLTNTGRKGILQRADSRSAKSRLNSQIVSTGG